MDETGEVNGTEFDATKDSYYTDDAGNPRVFNFSDGSYGIFWVKIGTDPTGIGVWGVIINDTGHYPVTFCDYQNEWGAQLDVIENKMYPGQSSEIIVVFSAKKNIPYHDIWLRKLYTYDVQSLGELMLVNQVTDEHQANPAITQLRNGSIVICWTN